MKIREDRCIDAKEVRTTESMTSIPDASHYAYRVMWSQEDDEFVATCIEFPSLSWLAESQIEALSGLDSLVAEVIADLASSDEPIPLPIADRRYSGRFNLRIEERLHRELALEAADAGVSLNQYVVRRLSES